MDYMKLAATLGKESIPLIQNLVSSYIEGRTMEKHAELFEKRISKSEQILNSFDPNFKNNLTKKSELTTGILEGEDTKALGNRKWKEYENHLEELPNDATPAQAQKALKEIQSNITESYPCESCKINATEHLKEFPLTNKSVTGKNDAK